MKLPSVSWRKDVSLLDGERNKGRPSLMSTVGDLALDEQLTARVFNAERRHEVLPKQISVSHTLPDEEALVSAAARRRDALYRRSLIGAHVLAAAGALFFS